MNKKIEDQYDVSLRLGGESSSSSESKNILTLVADCRSILIREQQAATAITAGTGTSSGSAAAAVGEKEGAVIEAAVVAEEEEIVEANVGNNCE